jgi:starch synthase
LTAVTQTFAFLAISRVLLGIVHRRNYGVGSAAEGKAAAKAELRRRMGLGSADVPLVAVVTRLTHQKGIHLIKHAAWRALERGAQFVLLGSAPDPRVQVRAC